jgi:hypothetical protein
MLVVCRSLELAKIEASVPKSSLGDIPGGMPWNEVLDTESATKSLKRNFDSGQNGNLNRLFFIATSGRVNQGFYVQG